MEQCLNELHVQEPCTIMVKYVFVQTQTRVMLIVLLRMTAVKNGTTRFKVYNAYAFPRKRLSQWVHLHLKIVRWLHGS